MCEHKKVSIIIPIYNTGEYLMECLNSIVNQTYVNTEIILVNDGSTDKSLSICRSYQETDRRIVIIDKQNEGLIAAWMDGVNLSTGDYLVFVDSDDWVELNMIEEMISHTNGQNEVICGNYILETKNVSKPCCQPLKSGIYQGEKLNQLLPNLLGNEERIITLSRCMKLFSRTLITNNLKYCNKKITMGEDVIIVLPAIISSERIVVLEKGLYYHYRQLDTSMVHRYEENLVEKISLLNRQIQFILQDKNVLNGEQQAKKEKIFLAFLVIKNEIRSGASGYAKRVIEFCRKDSIPQIVKSEVFEIRQKNNKLLFFCLQHPNMITIAILKNVIKIFDVLRK